jgi:hypothetical protein
MFFGFAHIRKSGQEEEKQKMTTNSSEQRKGGNMRAVMVWCLMALCVSSLWAAGQTSSTACVEPMPWQSMMQELRSLRIELLQEKLQRTDALLSSIQQQLRAAEAEQARVRDMESAHAEQLAELGQQLLQPGLSPQNQSDIEKHRSLVTAAAPRLAEFAATAARQEAELRDQLRTQQQLRDQLMDTIRALMGTAR